MQLALGRTVIIRVWTHTIFFRLGNKLHRKYAPIYMRVTFLKNNFTTRVQSRKLYSWEKNLLRGRTNFADQKWSGRTYNGAKICPLIQNWSGHINTLNEWRLILFSVKMANSSEEGDAKSGSLVEEAYEYLVRNVPVGASVARKQCVQRKAQKFVVKGTLRRRRARFQFG